METHFGNLCYTENWKDQRKEPEIHAAQLNTSREPILSKRLFLMFSNTAIYTYVPISVGSEISDLRQLCLHNVCSFVGSICCSVMFRTVQNIICYPQIEINLLLQTGMLYFSIFTVFATEMNG